MKKQEVINHYGSVRATANALGLSRQAVYLWPDTVPEIQAWRASHESGGELSFNWREEYLDKGIRPGPQKKQLEAA